MSSINRNQPEMNHADLDGGEAVRKIRELIDQAKTCFFCTTPLDGDTSGARPMSVRRVDELGHIWFLSASDSTQNEELARDGSVRLYFQAAPHSDFLLLNGQATVSRDREKIDELWEPVLRTWFTEGADDPRITVIDVAVRDGYYWDTKHGGVVAGAKMLIGAMLGKTLDDSIEGRVVV